MVKIVKSERRYKAGYVVKEVYDSRDKLTIKSAYTPEGYYIGTSKFAYRLTKRGIRPEIAPNIATEIEGVPCPHRVCSIGFSEKDNKWYGWSHRAIYGFTIGDKVKEGDCCASSGWTQEFLDDHPEADVSLPVGFTAKTMEDARKMAIAFAESVG